MGVGVIDSLSENRLVFTGKLEGNFIDGGLNLRQGFVNFSFVNIGLDILLEKTKALFVPYDPPVINYQELISSGNLISENPQIRLTQKIGSIEVANTKVIQPLKAELEQKLQFQLYSFFAEKEDNSLHIKNRFDIPLWFSEYILKRLLEGNKV